MGQEEPIGKCVNSRFFWGGLEDTFSNSFFFFSVTAGDSNQHSAEQKHQSLSSVLLTARPRHPTVLRHIGDGYNQSEYSLSPMQIYHLFNQNIVVIFLFCLQLSSLR